MSTDASLEKGDNKVDVHEQLAAEVYGTGEVDKFSTWGLRLRSWVRKLGAEENGIERIPPEARIEQNPRDLFYFFTSGNCCVTAFALGALGPSTFALGWWDSFLTILFFVPLGAFGPGLLVLLGPKTGLRTMTISRYAFGLFPGGVIAFVNVLTCIGWAMVTTMAGAQVFYSLSNTKVPMAVCILILAIVSYIISFLGYKWIHLYERYSWIIMFIFFIFLAGFSARYMENAPMLSGKTEFADVMSFGAVVLGSSITWGPFSADYATYMKEDTSKWKLFIYTWLGVVIGQVFVMWLGVGLMTTTLNNQAFADAYAVAGIGGLMDQSFKGYGTAAYGFGKFVQLGLVFSTVALIIPSIYSTALSMQNVGMWAVRIPRFIWTTVAFVVFTVAAIAGREHFAAVLSNFLNCLGYWVSPWGTIVLLEYWIYRRTRGYDLDLWWSQKGLPYGIAASISFSCSVVLAIMSMSQVWYVGPIALAAGGEPYGVDLGWCVAAALAGLTYPPLRYLELKYIGR